MSRTARPILYGLTLGVLLALLLAPQSGWLVRFQALSLLRFVPLPGYGSSANDAARERAVTTAHPNDYQLQYAATPWNLESLRVLETRFPNRASLRANVLRYAAMKGGIFSRPEDNYLMEEKPDSQIEPSSGNRPAELRAFDQDAATGERLDPDNAYFPFMRAAGLYAMHQDATARAAILRAGTKTHWAEYYDDEIAGRTRLRALTLGDYSAISHVCITAAVLLPHYSLLHHVARIATYQAMRDEQAGHLKEGVALRQALMHCGSLMRAQSQLVIGSFVGIAIAHTAIQRPGGAPWIEPKYVGNTLVPSNYLSDTYADYLHRSAFETEARYTLAEAKADQQAHTITSAWDRTVGIIYSTHLQSLMWCWVIGLALLSNVFWLLPLQVLAELLSHLPPVRKARPLPGWVIWGAAAGAVIAVGSLFFSVLGIDAAWNSLPMAVTNSLFLLALTVPVLLVWRARSEPLGWRSLGRRLIIATLTYAVLCVIYTLVEWQTGGVQEYISAVRDMMTSGEPLKEATMLHLLAPLIALAAPLLLIVTLSVVSRVRRVPVSAGLVSGCRAACLPLACVLLLVYGGMTLVTLHQERIVNDALTQSSQGEGAYVAAHTRQVWPGVVPEAKPGV